MDAVLILQLKKQIEDDFIFEMIVWRLPTPVPGSRHSYKYRCFFGTPGRRIIGYDNERGRGDHRHLEDEEHRYVFRGVSTLQNDFEKEIERWLKRNKES